MKIFKFKKMILVSLFFVLTMGLCAIVSCTKEENNIPQNDKVITKLKSENFNLPDGEYYVTIKGKLLLCYLANGNFEKYIDKNTGENVDPETLDFRMFPGDGRGERLAMEFLDEIHDKYACITMSKVPIKGPDDKIEGYSWVVEYGNDC